MPQVDYLVQVLFVTRGDKPEEPLHRLGPIHKLSFQLFDDLSDETKCLLGLLLPSLIQLALQVPLGIANLKGTAQNKLRGMFAVHPLQQCSGKQRLPNGVPATHTHKKADTIESHTLRLSQTEVDHHSRLMPSEVGVLPLHTPC